MRMEKKENTIANAITIAITITIASSVCPLGDGFLVNIILISRTDQDLFIAIAFDRRHNVDDTKFSAVVQVFVLDTKNRPLSSTNNLQNRHNQEEDLFMQYNAKERWRDTDHPEDTQEEVAHHRCVVRL